MTETELIDRVAKSVGCDPAQLKAKAADVLIEQGAAWKNANKSDEDCEILSLRVAARKITNANAQMKRTGATSFEGMFVSVPRYKEWGKILYNKMKGQLTTLPDQAVDALISSGSVVVFLNNHDGTYTRRGNAFNASGFEAGLEETSVDGLPKGTVQLDANTHFYVVWDKNNPTFPSGDRNFKYGIARPQDEKERTSTFFGREVGSTADWRPITVKASGTAADEIYPTFTPGTIGLKLGRNNNLVAYAIRDVSHFTPDISKSEVFDEPPVSLGADGQPAGLIPGFLPNDFLKGLFELEGYYNQHNGTDGWWDRSLALIAEVIHMDIREKGGYILICSDLDLTSDAPAIEVYVPAAQESRCDFAVGTKILLFGQTWRNKDDEMRLSVNGWWAFDEIEVANNGDIGEPAIDFSEPTGSQEGWD